MANRSGLPAAAAAAAALGAGYGLARWFRGRPEANGRYRPRPNRGGKRVLILGAGFGGLTTAMELAKLDSGLEVTLIDRVNFHLFTPILYQVATGLVEPGHIAYAVRSIAREYGFGFREGEVVDVDLDGRRVVLDSGELSYDALVVALGSTTNYFGNEGLRQHALPLKTLRDAIGIRNRILDQFERAEAEQDLGRKRARLTLVVVGGGATGVELIGSIRTLVGTGLLRDYPAIGASDVRLVLVEGGPSLLGGIDPWLGDRARDHLTRKGVEVMLDTTVTEVTPEGARLQDGTFIASRTVIWAAGVRPTPITADLALEKGRDGRLVVDEYLQVADRPGVYALGDCAWFPVRAQDGKPAPPNAATAVREARVVAHNVAAELGGGARRRYEYRSEGNLVSLGQGDAVVDVRGVRLEGLPAWLFWRGFYLSQLMGFKDRMGVLLDWFSAYFVLRDTAKLDIGAAETPSP